MNAPRQRRSTALRAVAILTAIGLVSIGVVAIVPLAVLQISALALAGVLNFVLAYDATSRTKRIWLIVGGIIPWAIAAYRIFW